MAQTDFGCFTYHGLIQLAYDESAPDLQGQDFGELTRHGLVQFAYKVEASPSEGVRLRNVQVRNLRLGAV